MGETGEGEGGYLGSEAYRKAFRLALYAHGLARAFPEEEKRMLVPELLESAAAIPLSIANGYRLGSRSARLYHLYIAYGRCLRLQSQLSASFDLRYIPLKDFEGIMALEGELSEMLLRLIDALK